MAGTLKDVKVPLLAHLYIEPANQRLVAYAIAARLYASRLARATVADEVGISRSSITQFLTRCDSPSGSGLPAWSMMRKLAAWLDSPGRRPLDPALLPIEDFLENRLPIEFLDVERAPSRWLWSSEGDLGSEIILPQVQGALLLDALRQRTHDRLGNCDDFVQGQLSEPFRRVLNQLLHSAVSPSTTHMRAEMILSRIAVLAPSSALTQIDQFVRSNPDGWAAMRVYRNLLRMLRHPERLELGADEVDRVREVVWTHLSGHMEQDNPVDTYPARSLLDAAVRQYLFQLRSHSAERRRKCAEWLVGRLDDPERPIRERMYCAYILAELPHRYHLRRSELPSGSEFGPEVAREFAARAIGILDQRQSEDEGLAYAFRICRWISELSPTDFVSKQPRPEIAGHEFDDFTTAVEQLVRSTLDTHLGPIGGVPRVAAHLHVATWRLVECSLLTLDGVRRRTCLETLATAGFSKEIVPIFGEIACDPSAPRFLREIATFGLSYLRHPDARIHLLRLANPESESLDKTALHPSIRHAAIFGLGDLPPLSNAFESEIRASLVQAIHSVDASADEFLPVLSASIRSLVRRGTFDVTDDIQRRWRRNAKIRPIIEAVQTHAAGNESRSVAPIVRTGWQFD